VRIEMAGVRRDHDIAALRLHPYRLQSLRVAADLVHGDARCDLVVAVVEIDEIVEHLLHHGVDVRRAERHADHLVAHTAARTVGHLGVLDVIARVREQVVIAGVVPMHVRGDHVVDLAGIDAERFESLADGLCDLAAAFLRGCLVESGVADEGAVWPLDHPDVVGDRRHLVVRVAENVILGALARMRAVADRVDLVNVVAHGFLPPTVTPARVSTIFTIKVKSLSPPYSLLVVSHCSSVAPIIACGTPTCFASSKQRRTTNNKRPETKPKTKVRGRIDCGNFWSDARERPEPALMTSIITAASRPAFTPMATASAVAALALVVWFLLASFFVCSLLGFSSFS